MRVLHPIMCSLVLISFAASAAVADTESAKSIKLRLGYTSVKIQPNGCVASLWASGRVSRSMITRFVDDHIRNDVVPSQINTPLMAAVARNNLEKVLFLINQDADLNSTNQAGSTALIWAAALGNSEIAETLLQAGAEITQRDTAGRSPLMIASKAGNPTTVKSLLEHGARVNAAQDGGVNEVGQTALHHAVSVSNNERVILDLIQNGADLDALDENGKTALMKAAWYGHINNTKLLVDAGADIELVANSGDRAIDFAHLRRHSEIIAFFDSLKIAD